MQNRSAKLWSVRLPALLLAATALSGARADVLELKNGGKVQGEISTASDQDASAYIVTTEDGGRVTVPKSEVTRVVSESDNYTEYQRKVRALNETADAHLQLAQWCRDHGLPNEYKQQLVRVVELDPDQAQARQALGYQKRNGQWMLREDLMTARGLVLYEGKYCTPQHVELMERAKQVKSTEADWSNRLERWRRWLNSRRQDRVDEAVREIRAVHDPQAAAGIVDLLRHEEDPAVKRMLIDVAAQIDHQLIVNTLVEMSLTDPDDETRYQCLDNLVHSGRPGLSGPYIHALKNPDNVMVNRAAEALKAIGDRDAIGPLIDALVTKHKEVISAGNPDQQSYMFTPSGGTAMNFGGKPPKISTEQRENAAVLAALTKLAGNAPNFGYDPEAWRNWLAADVKAHPVDVRRDP